MGNSCIFTEILTLEHSFLFCKVYVQWLNISSFVDLCQDSQKKKNGFLSSKYAYGSLRHSWVLTVSLCFLQHQNDGMRICSASFPDDALMDGNATKNKE